MIGITFFGETVRIDYGPNKYCFATLSELYRIARERGLVDIREWQRRGSTYIFDDEDGVKFVYSTRRYCVRIFGNKSSENQWLLIGAKKYAYWIQLGELLEELVDEETD